MELLRNFKNISKSDVSLAGGKGASLGEMTKAGISVPPGFVILSNAFEKFLEATNLNVEIETILDSVNHKEMHTTENASEKIKSLILQVKIPKDISAEIQKFFKNLNSKYVAVRSSATAEDSASAAWAGQLESYLNTTEETLLENVKKCWASLFTPRAIFYRFEKDLHKQKISVAVVVQKMVDSEKSGIAFSVHPVTQDRNQLIIEAGFGLGEAIVSGQITPDSYVVEKQPRRIIDKNIETQSRGFYRAESGGNEWRDIPKERGEKEVLSNTEILELSEIILRIENHYNFPCDIEWAFGNGKFYIVQSRPITTLKATPPETKQESLRYKFFYESRGYYFILDDMIASSYISWPIVELRLGDWKRVYVPEKVIKENCTKGLSFTKEEIDLKLNGIQKLIDELRRTRFEKASRKIIFQAIEIIAKLFKHYSYFDTSYSEGIYAENPKDERALLIEQSKNVVRDDFDFIFFRENGVLDNLIKAVAELTDVNADKIRWYRIIEIEDLLNKKINLNVKEIESRKKACVFDRNDKGQVYFLSGDKARLFIKKFEDNLEKESSAILRGTVAHGKGGKIVGKVCIIHRDYSNHKKLIEDMNGMEEKSILVTTTTDPEFIPAIKKSSAIITDIGGLLSHAAISARELNIPCIVGTENATKILKNGDVIEVDIENGLIKKLKYGKK